MIDANTTTVERAAPSWWLWALLLLSASAFAPGTALAKTGEYSEAELEQRLAQARHQLDEAARSLAELNRAKYSKIGNKPRKAMLGILIDDKGRDGGIRLTGLTPGGGAAEAGLKTGDRIVMVKGVELGRKGKSPLGNLSHTMRSVTAGDAVTVRYERDGKEREAKVVTRGHQQDMMAVLSELEQKLDIDLDLEGLEEGLSAAVAISAVAMAAADGMDLSKSRVIKVNQPTPRLVTVDAALGSYFGVEQGVLVVDAPADAGDLANGDILLTLDGKPMTDVTVARALLASAGAGDRTIAASVRRRGKEHSVELRAQAFDKTEHSKRIIRIESHGDGTEIIVEEDEDQVRD